MVTATKPRLNKGERRVRDRMRDPEYFTRRILGAEIYAQQQQLLHAVATSSRVAVTGANGTGKDFMAARAILWWLVRYKPSKVIVTAPTWRQINDIIWNEMRAAFASKMVEEDWGFHMYKRPRIESERNPQEHFAVGFATQETAENRQMPLGAGLQGYHSPRLLVVVSEAHAVKQATIDALRRLNPKCFLMTGNPFATTGEFYDAHHINRELWSTIAMSAYDTPNLAPEAPYDGYDKFPGMVTKADVDARREEWGEESPLFRAGVLDEFPDDLDDTIVPLWAAKEAARRTSEPTGPVIVACDVARFGRDRTVVVRRDGSLARIIWRVQGRDTMEIAGWLGRYAEDNPVDILVIDDTGVGGGVTDRLREVGLPKTRLVAFNGGSKAHDETRYANATSEAWMETRKWFLEGEADIDNDAALLGQLTSRGYTYQSDRRVKIQSKTEMAKSPDEADALTMTFGAGKGGSRVRFIG